MKFNLKEDLHAIMLSGEIIRCGNCKYWDVTGNIESKECYRDDGKNSVYGMCSYYPPKIFTRLEIEAHYPETKNNDSGCGKWELNDDIVRIDIFELGPDDFIEGPEGAVEGGINKENITKFQEWIDSFQEFLDEIKSLHKSKLKGGDK